jgi:hypothetical protein
MNDIAIATALANLVKTNNGLFKSEAQAHFIKSVAGAEYVSGGNVIHDTVRSLFR